MDFLLSCIIVPGLTLLLPGQTNWFTSNFSVAGAYFPRNILLILWAIVIARFYHTFLKRTIGQTKSFLKTEKELVLTDLSACLLVGSVLIPYRPQTAPISSFLHLSMAFTATILFYLSLAAMTGRLYMLAPDLFSVPAALLIFSFTCAIVLLTLCDFMISSALEIFLTLFSCGWLRLFYRKTHALAKRKYLQSRVKRH